MFASRIVHFSLLSNSHVVSPSSIMISLNPMINYAYDFDLLNSLFSIAWISAIPAFGLLLECLMYQVTARSCRVVTNIDFFILSSVTPCAYNIAFITNQNWSRSSFPTPLNTGSFIALAILLRSGGEDGMGEFGDENNETSGGVGRGGVGRGGMRGILCLIRLITLLGETFTSSSSSPRKGEIKGLVPSSVLPSFLHILPLHVALNINLFA